jgi:hypothetical protein
LDLETFEKEFLEAVVRRGKDHGVVTFNNMSTFDRELKTVTGKEVLEEFVLVANEGHFVPNDELETEVFVFLESAVGGSFVSRGVFE